MAVSKVEQSELSRMMAELKEKEGTAGVNRFIVNRMMELEVKETEGDEFSFWKEANATDSAKRINALGASLCCKPYGECGNFAGEWCINEWLPEDKPGKEALLGLLFEEYFKSAVELCIKKMRLGALVENCDKQRTLMIEIIKARSLWKELGDRFTAFKNNLLATRKQQQDVIVPENDVGGAPDKSPEIARGEIKNLESASSNVKLVGTFDFKAVGLTRESFRVLVEMMRRGNNKVGQQSVSGLDDAMTLGKVWTDAVVGQGVIKIWVGTLVDKHSIFEVLKREIAENWKMEKEVKDRIIAYQMEYAAVGMIAATAELAIGKDKKSYATMSGDKETKQDTEAKTV